MRILVGKLGWASRRMVDFAEWSGKQALQIQFLHFGQLHILARFEQISSADYIRQRTVTELGQRVANLVGNHEEKVDHWFRCAGKTLAQLFLLAGDTDRTIVRVADASHDAASCDQGN